MGEYNQFGRSGRIAKQYEKWIETHNEAGNYWDGAYYEGYVNGLILIEACENDNNIVNEFSFLYLPNAKQSPKNYAIFMDELV